MQIRPNSLGFTLLLGALAALPPLAIDMGLPALAAIGTSLNAPPAATGLTLSLFMAGFAIAQLIFGPVSDRYGRRPVLFIGCGVFALANVMCTIAPSIHALILWRLIAGGGAGAAAVLEMAIVRDLFEGAAARTQFSYINLVMSIAPMIAPTIGGLVLTIADWRSIYGVLAAGGLVLVGAIAIGFEESIARRDRSAIVPCRLIGNYLRVLSNRICVGYALVNALSFGCMFAYVAGSPLILIQVLDISTTLYGWFFAATAFAIMAGSFLNGRLSIRGVSPSRLLKVGLTLAVVSAIALVLVSISNHVRVITLLPLLVLNTFCFGLITPNTKHGALQPLPEVAGVAAAVLGFTQMLLGGTFASALVAFLYDRRTATAMTGVMTLFALAAIAAHTIIVRPAEKRIDRASFNHYSNRQKT
ncbi:multidrug effflux MFS transporter [Chroococcidiopsis sp [FACHB-1243]]|uniref:multidrug effflux MFS transporter n=1 Tax=Chroococcidiopsis sp. [FACHB-1243] TaxID=2692781 RepID=UPI0018EFAB72|nr:multidrug effflux MFS transporter [Chroococcidiopsis sp. [FACHB-1243]]